MKEITTKIETEILSPPKTRVIEFDCPACENFILFEFTVNKTSGNIPCPSCGAVIRWKEVKK